MDLRFRFLAEELVSDVLLVSIQEHCRAISGHHNGNKEGNEGDGEIITPQRRPKSEPHVVDGSIGISWNDSKFEDHQ